MGKCILDELNEKIGVFENCDFLNQRTLPKILIVTNSNHGHLPNKRTLFRLMKNLIDDRFYGIDFDVYFGMRNRTSITKFLNKVDVIPDFKFDINSFQTIDNVSWSDIDAILLFGFNEITSRLQSNEINFIGNLMNSGIGMFACGDHDKLGDGLCGQLPRIRYMQLWNSNKPGAEDEKSNCSVINPVVSGKGSRKFLPPQYDQTPAELILRRYVMPARLAPDQFEFQSKLSRLFLSKSTLPHVVFAGVRCIGEIDVIADHYHEGGLVDPEDFDFSSVDESEFPKYFSFADQEKVTLKWEVISKTFNHFLNGDFLESRGDLKSCEFGITSCYNGFLIENLNIGRIIVDSSFHHWTDGNLLLSDIPSPRKIFHENEMLNSVECQNFINKNENYHKNVVFWILRKETQKQIISSFFLKLIFETEFIERLYDVLLSERIDCSEIGVIALSFLSRRYSLNVSRSWWSLFITSDYSKLYSGLCYIFDFAIRMDEYIYGHIFCNLINFVITTKIEDFDEQTLSSTVKLIEDCVSEAISRFSESLTQGLEGFVGNVSQ